MELRLASVWQWRWAHCQTLMGSACPITERALCHKETSEKNPSLRRRYVPAWLAFCANHSLCQYQECGSDEQKARPPAWFCCAGCHSPLLLTGAWLSKMDFVHSPLAWRKLHVALYELGLPARLCETTGVGVVCVCETAGTELESGCDTQCVAQQPANRLPARAEACQVGTRGLLFILFILLRLVVCLLGEIKKQANKFLAWVLSGFFYSLCFHS